jgi:hypothetical protein
VYLQPLPGGLSDVDCDRPMQGFGMSGLAAEDLRAAEEEVHEAARSATGFDDFGDPMYLEGLRMILRALREDQGLQGMQLRDAVIRGPVVTGLIGRLYAYEGFRKHPEYRRNQIKRPLIVVGVPRTGTTALHQLLSQDRRFQGTESWLAHTPMVRPPRDRWDNYAEYRSARDRAEADRERLQALHWVAADEMDETNVVLRQTFSGNFSLRGPLPTYDKFFFGRNVRPAYQYIRDVVALIGLSAPETPWLLKNPGDILAPEALLAAFPDACVVCTHRDPVFAIPSIANLLVALRTGTQRYGVDPGPIDRAAMGRREFGYWKIALDRYESEKLRHPDRFHDVWQRDLLRDPLGVVRSIYERFGLELTADTEERMRRWAAESAAQTRSQHSYEPEEFGLTRKQICDHYADYRAAYGFK